MTASQARVLYMDDYIDFEHNIIDLANHISKSNHFTIGKLYEAINYLVQQPMPLFKNNAKFLHRHRIMRNWLSHTLRDEKIHFKQIKLCKEIKNLNKIISHLENLPNIDLMI